jgi:Spy/CpxP family protein refolding chaperone
MNRKLVLTVVLASAMIGGGSGAVLAGHGPGGEFGGPPPGAERGVENFEARMAKILKLTDAQQSKIKAFRDAERKQLKPLFDKMHESRKLLVQATEATTFDEAAVRALASEQSKIKTELIVSRAKVQNQINALLTPEQRELAKNLRPDTDLRPLPISEQ